MGIRFRLDARAAHARRLAALHVFAPGTAVEHVIGPFAVVSTVPTAAVTSVATASAAAVVMVVVMPVAFVLLVGVELRPVNRLDVLPQRARVRVALGATRGFADVGFLERGFCLFWADIVIDCLLACRWSCHDCS